MWKPNQSDRRSLQKQSIPGKRSALKISIILILLLLLIWGISSLLGGSPDSARQQTTTAQPEEITHDFDRILAEKYTGDFDVMQTKRRIRFLVPANKSFYFLDGARERGIAYEAGKHLEEIINKGKKRGTEVHVLFIPVARDKLIEGLIEGRGDIAMGGITITSEREKLVSFSIPTAENISEILVTGPKGPKIETLEDLAGQAVWIRKSSSYLESIKTLNSSFKKQGLEPIEVKALDEFLEAGDIIEMMNAGLFSATVMDDYLANLWTQVFPKVKLQKDVVISSGGSLGWAFRKNSPRLEKLLNSFIAKRRVGTLFGNTMMKRYFQSLEFVKNPTVSAERKRFDQTIKYFKKFGEQYDLDPLLLAAQGYQESGLRQDIKSRAGAVGVMQLLPNTGASMKVGSIYEIENNIHAGTKYLRAMIDRYYSDSEVDPLNKMFLAFASYNAGPSRISRLRATAAKEGYDKNKWFNNVELVVARHVGREPVRYVSNIYKYYAAYVMLQETNQRKESVKQDN